MILSEQSCVFKYNLHADETQFYNSRHKFVPESTDKL